MNIQKFAKQEVALRQIETALELFSRQGDLFSVITLAGAAEEILGLLLEQRSGKPGLLGALGSIFQVLRPGSRKADPQQVLSGHETEAFIHLDPRHEAVFLLGRAIEDYVELAGAPTAGMQEFLREVALQR